MKKTRFFMVALLCLCSMAIGFMGCSGDDDNITVPDLGVPPYQSVSGKYDVTSSGSPYESIELGGSGNYIVTLSSGGYSSGAPFVLLPGHSSAGFFGCPEASTRATQYGNLVYGTFIGLGDGRYQLEDFGIITLRTDANGQVTGIEVESSRYGDASLNVSKEDEVANDDMTNALCRTWRVQRVRRIITDLSTGEKHEETILPGKNPDLGEEILFSRAGTYLVCYGDNTLEMAEWRWRDQADGSFYYAWDGEWYQDAYATITFTSSTTALVYDAFEDMGNYEESYTELVTDEILDEPGDDPQEPVQPAVDSPLNRVFGDRRIRMLDDDLYTYEDGFLSSIGYDYGSTTIFHYNYVVGAGGPDVYTMDDGGMEQSATLCENGFVASVHHEEYDCITTFEYDAEGHVIHISDGREEREHELTWQDGDLVRVAWWRYSEDPSEARVFSYTYSDQPANGIMRFYDDYNMDIDVVEEFYYAGLLGIPSKHLIETETDDDGEVTRYVWTDHDLTKLHEDGRAYVDCTFSFYE